MRRADIDKLSAMFRKQLPQWTPVRLTRGRLALTRGERTARDEIVIWSGRGGHCWSYGAREAEGKENGHGWKDRLVEGVVASVCRPRPRSDPEPTHPAPPAPEMRGALSGSGAA